MPGCWRFSGRDGGRYLRRADIDENHVRLQCVRVEELVDKSALQVMDPMARGSRGCPPTAGRVNR